MGTTTEATPLKQKSWGESGGGTFSGVLGTVLSCLGCAVGAGNMWRFPRIVAASCGQKGALVFLFIWAMFLFLWSIPVLLIEYSAGRYTRKGVVQTIIHFLSPNATWCSMWIVLVNLFISGYFSVFVGWCLYYCVYFMVHPLPTSYEESEAIFNALTESYWPVLLLAISITMSGLAIMDGVKTLEITNLILTPLLLLIMLAVFVWSLTLDRALDGIAFFFSPDWASFLDPDVWVNAASQNAFDTGAGTGLFVAYAAYMSKDQSIVKYALGIPMGNNMISLTCGMTMFATSFSSLRATSPNISNSDILAILKTSGPGGTGITFMWLPVLLQSAGTLGRVIAVFIFLAFVLAGITSSVAFAETCVHSFSDFHVPRKYALAVTMIVQFLLGIGSALNVDFLSNQDTTWGYALLLVGLMLQAMVIRHGVDRYREQVINAFGPNDIKAPLIWNYIIKYLFPAETVAILLWWIVGNILNDPLPSGSHWYSFSYGTVLTVLVQWAIIASLTLLLNFFLLKCGRTKIILALAESEMQQSIGVTGIHHDTDKPDSKPDAPPPEQNGD